MKWHARDEEACAKHRFLLGEPGLVLVGAIGRMDITYVGVVDKTIKCAGRARDSEVARTFMERNTNLRVIKKVLVCLGDVGLKVFEE